MYESLYTPLMWQDWIISIVQWIFVIALIPTVIHPNNKPTLFTSLTTGLAMYVFSFTYGTLHLWMAVLSSVILGTAWLILAYQRYRLNRSAKIKL